VAEEKKIIVDEDWKSQVAAEKEAAERERHEHDDDSKRETAAEGESEADSGPQLSLPPASFDMLVTMFATEAMVGLGQIPHPSTGKLNFEPAQAKYSIDMLEVLAEKTKGNLTPIEESGLQQVLHQLRMAFVAVQAASGK
jgi:hypothetical protein